MAAAYDGHSGVVKKLLEVAPSALVNQKVSGYGCTVLSSTIDGRGYKEGQYLDVITALVEAGADVNQADGNGWTALICGLLWPSRYSRKAT